MVTIACITPGVIYETLHYDTIKDSTSFTYELLWIEHDQPQFVDEGHKNAGLTILEDLYSLKRVQMDIHVDLRLQSVRKRFQSVVGAA